MLARILFPIVRFALWVFYRRTEVRGRERVPTDRPLILVANHPNVMLDSLILGAYSPGRVPGFLGKSTLFGNPLYAFILRRLGVIPVSRSMDRGQAVSRNQDMLRLACNSLHRGRSLVLFPEGISHAALQVRSLKPGAARIALRTEDEADGEAGVCVVPVGLTYSDPGLFRSEVAVHFGEAIDVAPFLPVYRRDRRVGAQELTSAIHQRLSALTWHLEDPDLQTVVHDLASVYAENIARELPESAALSSRLRAGQEIIQAVDHFTQEDPDLVRSFAARLRRHHRKLKRLHIEPYVLAQRAPSSRAWHALLGILLAPLALYGFLNNALPYFLPRLFVRPYRQEPEMVGTVKLAIGAAAFPLYYAVRVTVAGLLWGAWNAFFYGITLPLSGLFVLHYKERFLERWPLWQTLVLPRKRSYYLRRLSEERVRLIQDLDTVKERYLAALEETESRPNATTS